MTDLPAERSSTQELESANEELLIQAQLLEDTQVELEAANLELRRALSELREREQRTRDFLHAIDEGYCLCEIVVDASGEPVDYRFLEVNPAFEELTGLRDAAGRTARAMVPELETHWVETYARVAREREPYRFRQGSEAMGRWFDVYATPAGDPGSGRFALLFTNITERRQTEQELERANDALRETNDRLTEHARALTESEERFRNMADNAPVMIWVTDPTGYCSYLNERWYEFTGQTPETGLGYGWIGATHPDDQQLAHDAFVSANARQGPFRVEYRLRRVDGEYRWAIDAADPRFGPGGEFLGYVGSVIEIHERKEIEQERELLLAEAQSARATAEEANLAKSQFLATMSHELRTPLNAIIGYADLLEAGITGPLNDPQRKQLERIELSARHLLHIIEEILTFSRVEAGREEVQIESIDAAELVRETAGLIEPLAAASALAFRCAAPDRIPFRTDPGKVRQILLNLLSNAVKFTPSGAVHLEAVVEDENLVIRVRDTGIGIASEHLGKIFEPFSQVDQAPSRRAGGTGLGLTVTAQLVRLLGGELEVQSAPGEGTTFVVRLPPAA